MSAGFYKVPIAKNEPVRQYANKSVERESLLSEIKTLKKTKIDVPMIIGGKEVHTKDKIKLSPPHEHKHILGYASKGTAKHVQEAIDSALTAKENWAAMRWEHRLAIFMKAGELLRTKYWLRPCSHRARMFFKLKSMPHAS
jgi:1-pyrroline-5-carboxylate dehydrogenase